MRLVPKRLAVYAYRAASTRTYHHSSIALSVENTDPVYNFGLTGVLMPLLHGVCLVARPLTVEVHFLIAF